MNAIYLFAPVLLQNFDFCPSFYIVNLEFVLDPVNDFHVLLHGGDKNIAAFGVLKEVFYNGSNLILNLIFDGKGKYVNVVSDNVLPFEPNITTPSSRSSQPSFSRHNILKCPSHLYNIIFTI